MHDTQPQDNRIAEDLQGATVTRADGVDGKVTAVTDNGDGASAVLIHFADGTQVVVGPRMLAPQGSGGYRLALAASHLATEAQESDIIIPVVAEELRVSTEKVTRGIVRVRTHVETSEQVVDAPITSEEVQIERVPIHALVQGEAPQVREEDGVVIVPVLEEVVVVEKRLMVREEIRLRMHVTQSNAPQTVQLRREVVEIERVPADGSTQAGAPRQEDSATSSSRSADSVDSKE